MIEWLIREVILTAYFAAILGSWRTFRVVVLPFALDRCPWGRCPEHT